MDLYKKGQKIKVKVISVDAKTERLALGIKQLTINPWIGIEKKLAAGDLVKGTIRYISEFGLFVETDDKVEGLLHINKMNSSLNSKEQLEQKYAVGDIIGVKILKIEISTQKLAFILPKSKKAKSVTEKGVDSIQDTDSSVVADTKTESTEKTAATSLEENKPVGEKQAESTEKTAATSLEENKPVGEKQAESTEKTAATSLEENKPVGEKQAESTEKTAATSLEENKPVGEKQAESTEKTAATSLEENKPVGEKQAESAEKTAATSLEENKPVGEKQAESAEKTAATSLEENKPVGEKQAESAEKTAVSKAPDEPAANSTETKTEKQGEESTKN